MEVLTKEEKLRILRAIKTDEEFRHALMGLLGFTELLESSRRTEENIKKIWQNIEKLWQEIKSLRENQEKLWLEVKSMRENQERLWQEVKSLREDQEKLWLEIRDIRRELREIRRMQETYSLTLEEEGNTVTAYFLERRGLKLELRPVVLDREYEFDIYGSGHGVTVVGEVKVRAGPIQIERFARRVEEASKRWPDKFAGKVVKVFYCLRAMPGTVEAAREMGVWLIESGRELTEPGI